MALVKIFRQKCTQKCGKTVENDQKHAFFFLRQKKNEANKSSERIISPENSSVKVMVIPANEELVVAREVYRLLSSENNLYQKNEANLNSVTT